MGSGVAGKGESGLEITLEVFNFLDVFNELAVHSLLDVSSFSFPFSFSIFSLLTFFISGFRGVLELVLCESVLSFEEGVIDIAGDSIN